MQILTKPCTYGETFEDSSSLINRSFGGLPLGGGGPYGADIYEQGIVPGKNTFGDMETTYRDQKIAQKDLEPGESVDI